MDVKNTIIAGLKKAIEELGVSDFEPELSISQGVAHGDYSTNAALVLSKQLKRNPMEIAQELVKDLRFKIKDLGIDKIEAVKPGFINFSLSSHHLGTRLQTLLSEEKKIVKSSKSQKIMLEFADPNPFKEFHIGHLRNITLGESYARLLEALGNDVWRVNYEGDVGMHVAKCLYGILQAQNAKRKMQNIEKETLAEKAKFLGECYAIGAKAYEDDEEAKKEIQQLNKKVYKKDPSIMDIWKTGRAWSLEKFEEMYKRVGTVYKHYYFESEIAEKGKEIVLSHIKDGIFEKSEGAVVYHGEEEGLHTRVFVTKEDYATYEAKDMALAGIKYEDFKYDRSIILTAHEQTPYFQVVLSALGKVFPDLAAKTAHQAFGFVNLKEGKMSSRTGNVITGSWLLDEAKTRLKKVFPDMDEQTLEAVGVGAVKYGMLKFARESDIQFSFDESVSLEGNSGPYIQYTYARTQSVLAKAKNNDLTFTIEDLRLETEERNLLRLLVHFDEIVEAAGNNFAPQLLCNYLFELSQGFNLFYQKCKIIGSPNQEFRLALTQGVGKTIKNGLHLLGIEAPERM